MRAMAILFLPLAGCAQPEADSVDEVRASALSCVERQVPDGTLVSAPRAQVVLSGCRSEFESWARAIVERAYDADFTEQDASMVSAYDRVLSDHIDLIQLRISDGPHQNLPKI